MPSHVTQLLLSRLTTTPRYLPSSTKAHCNGVRGGCAQVLETSVCRQTDRPTEMRSYKRQLDRGRRLLREACCSFGPQKIAPRGQPPPSATVIRGVKFLHCRACCRRAVFNFGTVGQVGRVEGKRQGDPSVICRRIGRGAGQRDGSHVILCFPPNTSARRLDVNSNSTALPSFSQVGHKVRKYGAVLWSCGHMGLGKSHISAVATKLGEQRSRAERPLTLSASYPWHTYN
jgi:hypothetical protein